MTSERREWLSAVEVSFALYLLVSVLDTGTTTRNNIAELYSQFELLYNNSVNMTCWCDSIYHENRDKEIDCQDMLCAL